MGQAWAKNLRDCDEVETAGWVDIRLGAVGEAIEKHKLTGIKPYTDLQVALNEIKPDFVVDVTIPEAHHDVTLAALAAGAHVLGEKPMADSMERARAMVAASEKAERLYMVSQSRRYDAKLLAFRQLVRDQIGPLGILNSDFYIGAHFGGFREQMKSVLLLDMAIHTFDNARQISGADPLAVYCEEFNPAWSWYSGNSSAAAFFEMTGGLRYTYRGSWCSEGLGTSWQSEWRAVGPRGTAIWDGTGPPRAGRVTGKDGFIRESETILGKAEASAPEGIAGSLREFLAFLRDGTMPQGECHDNIKSLAMVFAAVESAATGKRVSIAS